MTKIYSMVSNDCVFPVYSESDPKKEVQQRKAAKKILIAGGANVAKPRTDGSTPKFVVTDVSADDLKALQEIPAFKRKVDRGFYVIGKEPTVFKADGSAQITEEQLTKKNPKAKVSTGTADE